MKNYNAETYGERIAGIYDDLYSSPEESAIDLLGSLADGGRALELGIGTGRIALPLKARGIDIQGIDASPSMVKKLRAKPGGTEMHVTSGDFSEVEVEGNFDLIFVVFNTFFSLTSQESQLRCLQNIARHLEEDGVFLIEAFVPDLKRFCDGQSVRAVEVNEDMVRLDVSKHDPVSQQISSQHVMFTEEGVKLYPVSLRYTWPSELDMMARAAGLELSERWGNWEREPFSSSSGRHISVYRFI